MVKRKRLPSSSSSSSKPTTAQSTTIQSTSQNNLRRSQNGRQSTTSTTTSLIDEDSHLRRQIKRSRSTDSADSTATQQIRGRSAPTSSSFIPIVENGKSASLDSASGVDAMTDVENQHTAETLSPVSDKTSEEQDHSNESHPDEIEVALESQPPNLQNGRGSRHEKAGKASSGGSSQEATLVPQISITESSSVTDATHSLVNGRATASESLSSLSEIDTVDSEAETERIEDEEETLEPMGDVVVPDGEETKETTSAIALSEEDGAELNDVDNEIHARKSSSRSPTRGRKRRRRDNDGVEDGGSTDELPIEPAEEEEAVKPEKESNDGEEKPAEQEEMDIPGEELEEPEAEESTSYLMTMLTVVDEEKAEANKKRAAALDMLKDIEEEFAKLRDRYPLT